MREWKDPMSLSFFILSWNKRCDVTFQHYLWRHEATFSQRKKVDNRHRTVLCRQYGVKTSHLSPLLWTVTSLLRWRIGQMPQSWMTISSPFFTVKSLWKIGHLPKEMLRFKALQEANKAPNIVADASVWCVYSGNHVNGTESRRVCVWIGMMSLGVVHIKRLRLRSHKEIAVAIAVADKYAFFEIQCSTQLNWLMEKIERKISLSQDFALCEWTFIPLDEGRLLLHLDPAERGGSLNQQRNVSTLYSIVKPAIKVGLHWPKANVKAMPPPEGFLKDKSNLLFSLRVNGP